MKSFNLYLDNIKGLPPELSIALFGGNPRRIGISYKKEMLLDKFGVRNILTFWLWKWFRDIIWISKE